jgi:hypothetical protein
VTIGYILENSRVGYLDNNSNIIVDTRNCLRKRFVSVKLPRIEKQLFHTILLWCDNYLNGRYLYPRIGYSEDLHAFDGIEFFFERKSEAMLFKLKWG